MRFIGGWIGPCHIPARMMFSAFMRIPGGRLVILSRMGHIDCFAELKSCTPSEHKIRPVCSGTVRKPPGSVSFRYSSPSYTSWIFPSITFLVNRYWNRSHLSAVSTKTKHISDIKLMYLHTWNNWLQMILEWKNGIIARIGMFAFSFVAVFVLFENFLQAGWTELSQHQCSHSW